jgi:hypothetical protein
VVFVTGTRAQKLTDVGAAAAKVWRALPEGAKSPVKLLDADRRKLLVVPLAAAVVMTAPVAVVYSGVPAVTLHPVKFPSSKSSESRTSLQAPSLQVWVPQGVDTDFCAMCGHDWCSVRISKEIQEFASGKADGYERIGTGGKLGAAVKSAALTPEQQEILAKRGVLSPEEIHKLASKTKKHMAKSPNGQSAKEDEAKLSCHSDYVDPDDAKRMQAEKAGREVLVPLDVRPALGIAKEDRVI